LALNSEAARKWEAPAAHQCALQSRNRYDIERAGMVAGAWYQPGISAARPRSDMPFADHPLRTRVVSEMHMRRMPPLAPPMRMVQMVRLLDPAERAAERAHVLAMPGVAAAAVVERSRHIGGHRDDGMEYMWECHSEATTTTLIMPASATDAFQAAIDDAAAMQWLLQAPGLVLRAVQIAIVAGHDAVAASMAAAGFSEAEIVSGAIGPVRIWSDFLIRGDNFGRLLVASGDLPAADLGRVVQQVQELGNYRNLALMGLPLAQEQGPRVAALEDALVDIAQRMAAGEADASLLDQLCELAAQVTAITASTAFRMSATAAYAQIVQDRIEALNATGVAGYQTLEEFTDRRLLPATRTCASFTARLEALSVRIERATSLLRTRVEMALQTQNAGLLQSMDRNAARQLRLQRVVEGLSVVAVSYYAVSLLSYLLREVAARTAISHDLLVAVSVVPVVGLVWLYLHHRVRRIVELGS
jgi:uncharacterized membrane-anchored protein